MRVLHIAENSNGYERVELLANRVNQKNHLAVIKKEDGSIHYTGGFLFYDTRGLRALFDTHPKTEHYVFAALLRTEPFEKDYYEED